MNENYKYVLAFSFGRIRNMRNYQRENADRQTRLAAADVSIIENPYASVFDEYADIKGWLQVEGTVIDYPVLQREGEDEYYLYLNFKGEEDKRGSLPVWRRNSEINF